MSELNPQINDQFVEAVDAALNLPTARFHAGEHVGEHFESYDTHKVVIAAPKRNYLSVETGLWGGEVDDISVRETTVDPRKRQPDDSEVGFSIKLSSAKNDEVKVATEAIKNALQYREKQMKIAKYTGGLFAHL